MIHHPFIAFDTENDPKTGEFISAAIYGYYNDHHGKQHHIEDYFEDRFALQECLARIAKSGGEKNIAYNLCGFNVDYDLTYIREIVDDTTRISVGSRLITARLKVGGKKGIPVYDASNYVRGSLESWIKTLNMKEKYGVVKLPLEQLRERNIMDAKATYHLMNWIENTMNNEFKIPLQLTIGSCALKYFQNHFLKEPLMRNSNFLNDFERKAYRGGRVEVFKRGAQRVKSWDVNSMYLSVMRDEKVPIPQSAQYVKGGCAKRVMSDARLQIIHAIVSVPKQRIAPLPYFDEKRHKLLFPIGTFEGYWTSVELKEALKFGVEIKRVIDYIYYNRAEPLFHDYAENIWNKRKQIDKKKHPDLNYMYKTMGNSLYGKFGERRTTGGWIKKSDLEGSYEGGEIREYQGEEYVYFPVKEQSFSTHSFPCIPVFITSYARVKLLRMMKSHEDEVVYCDTDSVHFLHTVDMPDSDELGGWGYEYEKIQTYHRPKLYGEKRKGVPKRAVKIEPHSHEGLATNNVEYYSYEKPLKRAEAIRRGDIQNRWIDVLKKVSLVDDKRVWNGDESEPIDVTGDE